MSYERIGGAGLIPVGFQKITLNNSTAVGLNSTVIPCTVIDFSVETNNARYRADGTDPTTNTGVLVVTDQVYRWDGYDSSGNALKFQRVSGTSVISIQTYRRAGDET